MKRKLLAGLYPEEISALLPKEKEMYRGTQIFRWIHERCVLSFDDMTNLPKTFRQEIAGGFRITALEILDVLRSSDGMADKYLFSCDDGRKIESVVIRDGDRVTVCVSSQIGCKMKCSFCRTGTMGFIRDLSTAEILDQLIFIRHMLRRTNQDISNIVFMGMGEPLDNYESVTKAISILNMEIGFGIGARKITVSTCGIVPGIKKLGKDFKRIGLAVSLNSTDNQLREELMPINKKYPLPELLETVRAFVKETKRRVTFEYILMSGVNDSPAQARDLRKLASRIPSKVNLIPFNEFDGSPFKRPSDEHIEMFQNILIDGNVTAMVRKSKGEEILAACGQLASKNKK